MPHNENVEIYALFNEMIGLAIDHIYSNRIEEGLNIIVKIMELYNEIKPYIIDSSDINEIDNVFNLILIASEKKDYILAADLLEYELNALLLQLFDLYEN